MKKVIIYFITLITFSVNAQAADWFDTLLDQNVSSPAVYMNQQRGYFTAGGIQSRTPNSRLRLVSLTPPKITAGCGGIDIFWGGFNFLNPEYLVQAFQNILSHAPAFAFDLALKTLCAQCSETMKALESIANKVNSMASDDCAISKAGVDWTLGGLFDSVAAKADPADKDPTSDIMGFVNDKVLKNINGQLSEITADIKNLISDTLCHLHPNESACVKFHLNSGSFWAKVVEFDKQTAQSGHSVLSQLEAELMASVFGDVYFVTNDSAAGNSTGKNPPPGSDQQKTLSSTLFAIPPLESKLGPEALIFYFTEFPDEGSTDYWENIELYSLDPGSTSSAGYGTATTRTFPEELRFGKQAFNAIKQISAIFRAGGVDEIPSEAISAINESPVPLYSVLNTYALKYYINGHSLSSGARKDILEGTTKPGADMLGDFMTVQEARVLAKLAALGKTYNFMTRWNSRAYALMGKYRAMHAAGQDKAGFPKESYHLAFQSVQDRIMVFNNLMLSVYQRMFDELQKQTADEIGRHQMRNNYANHLKQSLRNRL